jgi:small GTP-binding protein
MKNSDDVSVETQEESLISDLEHAGVPLSHEQKKLIKEKIRTIKNYIPKVGILGKTGAGKSSLCNALFGKKVAEISDIVGCTREPAHLLLSMSKETGGGLVLVDVPGVGESIERDDEYSELYRSLLPELDLVLWVIKADDRALSVDQKFYEKFVQQYSKSNPVIFVLNQADKIEPVREWDELAHQPGSRQLENLIKKAEIVSSAFGVPIGTTYAVSANENFGLVGLVDLIVESLPNEKKFGFVRETKEENVSRESRREAEKGMWDSIKEFAGKAKDFYEQNKEAIHTAASVIWSWFKKKIT